MKTVIFYFTGTGNNLWTAKKLKEQLGDADMFPMYHLKTNKHIKSDYTHIIIVSPSYFSHIPPFVQECLREVVFTENQKIITIVDCGGNRGMAIEDLRESINKCGKKVVGEYMIIHPGNYILSYGAFPKIYQIITLKKAKGRVKKIAHDIKENHMNKLPKAGMFYKEKDEKRLQKAISSFSEIGLQYEVNNDCLSCGICEKVCPAKNIQMKNKKPVFQNNCQQCMACIQWCPQKAIDKEGKAKDRKRYHNMEISLHELIEKNCRGDEQ